MTIHDSGTYVTISTYELYRMGERMIAQRRPRDAARALRVVVDREPGQGSAWELLGQAHFAAAHLERAEDAFRRVIELEPVNGWAHVALARSLERQSRHDEAAGAYRVAASLGQDVPTGSRVGLHDVSADAVDPGPIDVDLSEQLGG